jgi:protein-S-isoprenylcysteine O-methyltransferase Ste14
MQHTFLTIIPEFEIGLLNAWIGTFTIMLMPYFFRWILGRKRYSSMTGVEDYNKKEKKIVDYTMAVYYLSVLYSIVLPLKIASDAFIAGAMIYILALIGLVMTYLSFYAVTPGEMVSKGIYRISRNPFYFFTCLAYLGVSIASLSWLLLLLTCIFSVLQHQVVLAEERICQVNFGKRYLDYRQKTPRYFLFF